MINKKVLWVLVGVIVCLVIASSGWIYHLASLNNVGDEEILKNEVLTLQNNFYIQYGENTEIIELKSPEHVYYAIWVDKSDNTTYVSWAIGGIWSKVWSDK